LDMTANGANNQMIITRSDHADANHANYALSFQGFASGPVFRYQPIVSLGAGYLVRFQAHVPSSLVFQLNNAEVGDSVGVAVCYPLGTIITSVQRGLANYAGNAWPSIMPQSSVSSIPVTGNQASTSGDSYYFDQARGILFINLQQRNARTDYGNFCPEQGCDWVWVTAQFTAGAAARDCTADAYNNGFLRPAGSWLNQQVVPAAKTITGVLQSILSSAPVLTPPSAPTVAPTTAPTVAPTVGAPSKGATAKATTPVTTTKATTAPVTAAAPSKAATAKATTAPTAAPTSNAQCNVQCASGFDCCGSACYLASEYQCNNGVLCQKGYLACGSTCYSASTYTCDSGNILRAR